MGLMLVVPEENYFSTYIQCQNNKQQVARTQFRLSYSNVRISYGAQGYQWEATVTDLQSPPSMTAAVQWLSVCAMSYRATRLEGLLLPMKCALHVVFEHCILSAEPGSQLFDGTSASLFHIHL